MAYRMPELHSARAVRSTPASTIVKEISGCGVRVKSGAEMSES
jgi:hypothetical protein